jgi:hypothetical protein
MADASITGVGDSLFGTEMFSGCSRLTSVSLPSTLKALSEKAFYSCTLLTSLTLPSSLESIGGSVLYNAGVTSMTLPNTLTTLATMAFSYSKLTSIVLPASVTTLNLQAISYCSNLISVDLSALTLTDLGDYAFYNNSALTSVTLPATLTKISNSMFFGCSALESLTIPADVTTIGTTPFSGCTKLGFTIGDGNTLLATDVSGKVLINETTHTVVTGLGATGAVSIPAGVLIIGASTFQSNTAITAVTIPASVTSIQATAFGGCTALATITLEGTTPPTLAAATAIPSATLSNIYVPSGALTVYTSSGTGGLWYSTVAIRNKISGI